MNPVIIGIVPKVNYSDHFWLQMEVQGKRNFDPIESKFMSPFPDKVLCKLPKHIYTTLFWQPL